MMNTLTWDIKPIALPKINSNLLSVVSLILLLTMVFLTASAIAYHCGEIQKNLALAVASVGIATTALELSKGLLKIALASGNPWAIAGAIAAVGLSAAGLAAAAALVVYYTDKLAECEKGHGTASGGCGSGSCGTG